MFKSQAIKDLEDKIYEKIAKEIEDGDISKGLWTKAKADTSGDDSQIESRYIQLRFNQLKEKSIADHEARVAEKNQHEAEVKKEEKKRKKLGAGFSAVIWVLSFIVIWSNLDWAKSIGFESSEEANDALMELLMYSAAHIISIPFVLMRGRKIDKQRRYVGEDLKIYTSSFNIRLVLVFIFIGIIVWTIAPTLNRVPIEPVDLKTQLEEQSEALNESLPYMVDSETQLYLTFVSEDLKFNYEYILVNYEMSDLDWNELETYLDTNVQTQYCNHPDIAFYRNNKVPMVWNYYSKSKVKIGEIEKAPDDCK